MSRVLIVEQAPGAGHRLCRGLEAEGYEADVVADGASAETLARQNGFDAILLDLVSPGEEALTLCRELRAAQVRAPIIAIVSGAGVEDRAAGFDVGVSDYVDQTEAASTLAGSIRHAIRRAGEEPSGRDFWRHGALVVDFRRQEASRAGLPLPLTPMQFRLLRVFVEHAGQVLGAREIIDLVWGEGYYVSGRVVYTHINNLRGRLEDDPSNPTLIVNRRRFGYLFTG